MVQRKWIKNVSISFIGIEKQSHICIRTIGQNKVRKSDELDFEACLTKWFSLRCVESNIFNNLFLFLDGNCVFNVHRQTSKHGSMQKKWERALVNRVDIRRWSGVTGFWAVRRWTYKTYIYKTSNRRTDEQRYQ